MTLRRLIPVFCMAGLLPAVAAAQPAPVPMRVAAPRPDAAWFERYQEGRVGPEQTDSWSKTFKVGPAGSLDLENLSGDVAVTGAAGDEIRVEAVKRVRARDAAAAARLLAELVIEATERAGRVEIRTTYPRAEHSSVDVSYTVQVPATAAVAVRTVSGDIRVSKVNGEVRLETVSGNIAANGLAHVARLKSVSGDVEITEAGTADGFTAGTVSGNLVLRRFKAQAIDLQTVSGDLALEGVACEKALARTVSGDVHFKGPIATGGRYELTSHSGDLWVGVAGAANFEMTASSFSGDIRSDLDGLQVPADSGDRPAGREVRATVGNGSARLVVKTFSGDLVVTGAAKKDEKKAKEKE